MVRIQPYSVNIRACPEHSGLRSKGQELTALKVLNNQFGLNPFGGGIPGIPIIPTRVPPK